MNKKKVVRTIGIVLILVLIAVGVYAGGSALTEMLRAHLTGG